MTVLVYIFTDLIFAASGQFLLKKAMSAMEPPSSGWQDMVHFITNVVRSGYVWLAVVCYGISFLLWLVVLSKAKLSYAYPFTSLIYLLVLGGSWWLFDERISMEQTVGVAIILIGIFLVQHGS